MPDKLMTHDNIEKYLKDLAKEYKRLTHGNADAEIVIAGGGSVLLNHDFRDTTNDLDAIIGSDSAMKEAISIIADRYELPPDWINSDFKYTSSFSKRLREVSVHYRTFSNILDVRTVPDKYIVAMKLESGREYKHDLSDIIGILKENAESGTPITKEDIDGAISELYGNAEDIPEKSKEFISQALSTSKDDYDDLFFQTSIMEDDNRGLIEDFQEEYPDVLKQDNINDILEQLQKNEPEDEKRR